MTKRFFDYLAESQDEKKYVFKIKVAGELPEHFEDTLESALKKYDIISFKKGNSTPIQEKSIEFPELKNVSYTTYCVELRYPTTSSVLQAYIPDQTGISQNFVKVRSEKEEDEVELNHERPEKSTALLNTPAGKENNQDTVGQKGISNFLKDIAKAKTQLSQYKGVNDSILAKSTPKEKSQSSKPEVSTTSPLTSVKNPNPRTGK